jgi:hypothetical protein
LPDNSPPPVGCLPSTRGHLPFMRRPPLALYATPPSSSTLTSSTLSRLHTSDAVEFYAGASCAPPLLSPALNFLTPSAASMHRRATESWRAFVTGLAASFSSTSESPKGKCGKRQEESGGGLAPPRSNVSRERFAEFSRGGAVFWLRLAQLMLNLLAESYQKHPTCCARCCMLNTSSPPMRFF